MRTFPLMSAFRRHNAVGLLANAATALVALWGIVASAHADVPGMVRELIQNQRRIVVLRETSAAHQRVEAARAGQYLFFSNRNLSRALVLEIQVADPDEAAKRYGQYARALDDPTLEEIDRLVMRASLEALLRSKSLRLDLRRDAQERVRHLADLRDKLGIAVELSLWQTPLQPGAPPRPQWEAYVRKLTETLSAGKILADMDRELFSARPEIADDREAVTRARFLEWDGLELPERTILLTFDDGPHPIYTPAVLEILKDHAVHGIFYQLGRNLGEIRNGLPVPGANRELVARIVAEGHAVGNHSYSHLVMTAIDSRRISEEIETTQALIEGIVPPGAGRTRTFRAPYGARSDLVMTQIDVHRLRSVLWNIDSEDWADPIPESIVHRVVQEAEQQGRGIVLLHDIHARTVDALPRLIVELRRRGFRFLRWDGARLVVPPHEIR